MEIESGDRLAGQFLSYVFAGNTSRAINIPHEEMLIGDRISFRLYDSFGALSIIGTASLAITSRLRSVTTQSRNDSSWMCVEDVESQISVYVEDTSEKRRNVTIVFTGVPERGLLRWVDANNSRVLTAGDTLRTTCAEPHTCRTSVRYLSRRNFFNSPLSTWNGDAVNGSDDAEVFSFYAVASDNGEFSNEIVQDIQVTNVNDPSGLRCPTHQHHVQAVGISTFSGDEFLPLDRIAIQGIWVDDPDNSVDIVKVIISTRFGFLTLNKDFMSLLDFNSVIYCYELEISECLGSGTSDRILVFFAEPRYAQMALNGMTYQSVIADVVDDVNITIFDGADGDCLSKDKFQPGSLRYRCWRESCRFQVVVAGHDSLEPALNMTVPPQICVSVSLGFCVLLSLCRGRCRKRKRRFSSKVP